MKKLTFWTVIIIEAIIPNLIIYFINKFKNMEALEYFIISLFISLILFTILYQFAYKKIKKLQKVIEFAIHIIDQKTDIGVNKYVNENIDFIKKNQDLA